MNLIVETDLGHDPDDFFALCYLHSAGVNIRAILLAKGHPFQIEIARFFCEMVGLKIPIGNAADSEVKLESGNFHKRIMNRYQYACDFGADALGFEVIEETLRNFPDCEFFVCGPPKNLGKFLKESPETDINRVTMQGGFLSYNLFEPAVRLPQFEGKDEIPTFNLNGAKKETQRIVDSPRIKDLRFVSKNVCHTVIYDRERHDWVSQQPSRNMADELFLNGMDIYLKYHQLKKFHDPTAAVCHLHPEIATWFPGQLYSKGGGWGTSPFDGNSKVIADINREKLWSHFKERN